MLKRFPIAIIVLTILSFLWPVTPLAAATSPVSVVLGGTGSASWSISGIAPGDGGTKSVSVQNAGTGSGELRIWLSNLTGTEGTPAGFETPTPGDTGELGQYLTLKVQGSGLSSNVNMPALPTAFPAGAADAAYIKANLNSGQTINLTWTWSLPASTGNIVQGDGISFTINYALNEVVAPPTTTTTTPPTTAPATTTPSTTGPGPTPPITITPPMTTAVPPPTVPPTTEPIAVTIATPPTTTPPTTSPSREIVVQMFGIDASIGSLTPDGRLKSTLIAVSPDGEVTLALPEGMLMISDDGELLSYIDISVFGETPPSLSGHVLLGKIYQITAYDASGHASPFTSDTPFLLSLPFQQSQAPSGTQSVYIAYFDPATSFWSRLPVSGVTASGHIQAMLRHFSLYAALADVSPFPIMPAAAFEIGAPTLQPTAIQANKPVTISASITNTGNVAGEYLLHAYIPGVLDATQLITLGPGASQEVSFTVAFRHSGTYTASIGDKQVSLVVSETTAQPNGFSEFIRRNIEAYIGFTLVLVLLVWLAGATIFSNRRA